MLLVCRGCGIKSVLDLLFVHFCKLYINKAQTTNYNYNLRRQSEDNESLVWFNYHLVTRTHVEWTQLSKLGSIHKSYSDTGPPCAAANLELEYRCSLQFLWCS